MTQSMVVEPPTDLSGISGSPSQKRKRFATGSASPESRRLKRERGPDVPMATMSTTDADTAEFIANAVSTAQAMQEHVNVEDFNALQHVAAAEQSGVTDHANVTSTAAAALGSMYPPLHDHRPSTSGEGYDPPPANHDHHAHDHHAHEHHHFENSASSPTDGLPSQSHVATMPPPPPSDNNSAGPGRFNTNPPSSKPAVGTEEWQRLKKDNHKEVERRRRETINEGINELAKIVPGCEKNKGSILQRAVAFITQLKENEAQNIEKWTLEKLLTEQAIAELSALNDKLKSQVDGLYKEAERWKRLAEKTGHQPSPTQEQCDETPAAS